MKFGSKTYYHKGRSVFVTLNSKNRQHSHWYKSNTWNWQYCKITFITE